MSFSISQLFLDNKPECRACKRSPHFFCGCHVHARCNTKRLFTVTLFFRWIDYSWSENVFRHTMHYKWALLILQPFRHFIYVTAYPPTLPWLHLRHNSFYNPSFASPTSQALHLRHLVSRTWHKFKQTK